MPPRRRHPDIGRIAFRREPLPPLDALAREWRALEAVARPSFFTSWRWIGTFIEALPETRRPMLLRGALNGETVALALLGAGVARRRRGLIRSRVLHLNETGDPQFDAVSVEHNGLLAAAGCEAAAEDALVAWFAGLRAEADELCIGGSLRRLPEAAVEGRGLGRREISVPSFVLDLRRLSGAEGELYPVLSANARQQLRRAIRHFARRGPLGLEEARSVAEAHSFFTALKALHCASWERRGKRHAFAAPHFEGFHRLLIERNLEDGGVQLLRLGVGDRTLGYLYNFRLDGRVYAYQSGFDDADPRDRPGVVSHALAIRHAFRSGADIYDFMAGRNRLKESFATQCEPMLWQVVQQPRLAFRIERLAGALKRAVGWAATLRLSMKMLAGGGGRR
jgi:CelD/BcsL family acetyltransferase involved in cellulose biosynthesis